MKLTIERLIALSTQYLIDLGKIWLHQQPKKGQCWLNGGDGKALFAAPSSCKICGYVKSHAAVA